MENLLGPKLVLRNSREDEFTCTFNISDENRTVYSHFICGTDTENITIVFDAVTDMLIKKNLEECGL